MWSDFHRNKFGRYSRISRVICKQNIRNIISTCRVTITEHDHSIILWMVWVSIWCAIFNTKCHTTTKCWHAICQMRIFHRKIISLDSFTIHIDTVSPLLFSTFHIHPLPQLCWYVSTTAYLFIKLHMMGVCTVYINLFNPNHLFGFPMVVFRRTPMTYSTKNKCQTKCILENL